MIREVLFILSDEVLSMASSFLVNIEHSVKEIKRPFSPHVWHNSGNFRKINFVDNEANYVCVYVQACMSADVFVCNTSKVLI